jgi:hypothetical protein
MKTQMISLAATLMTLTLSPLARGMDTHGGSSGSAFSLDCGSDGVMVAAGVSYSHVVNGIDVTCVKLKADGSWKGAFYSAGRRGGYGKNYYSNHPFEGKAVARIYGRADSAFVIALGFSSKKVEDVGGVLQGTGPATGGMMAGGTAGTAFDETCPAGQVARGLDGRWSSSIPQIRLVCHTPVPAAGTPTLAFPGTMKMFNDVVAVEDPGVTVQGGVNTMTPVKPGPVVARQSDLVSVRFNIRNRKWNGSMTTSLGRVPYQIKADGQVIRSGAITNLTSFVLVDCTVFRDITQGRHTLEVVLDPSNTLGEGLGSNQNNKALWQIEAEHTWDFQVKSVQVVPGTANNNDIVTIRATILNKRYDTRSILVYFGPLADIPPEQMYLKTYGQCEARTVSCSPFGQYVWIDHGENVVEKTIRACGTSGQKIQMKVVLDPKAELAEKASERANNIGSGTVTIR